MLIGTASRISVSYTMQQLRFIAYAGGGSIAHVGLHVHSTGTAMSFTSLAPSSLAGVLVPQADLWLQLIQAGSIGSRQGGRAIDGDIAAFSLTAADVCDTCLRR